MINNHRCRICGIDLDMRFFHLECWNETLIDINHFCSKEHLIKFLQEVSK